MNVKEASQLITMINNEYTWASKGMTENDLKAKWKTWAADFKEIPYETVKAAWDYYRINDDLNRPPNVGALMKIIKNGQNQADGTLSAEDAWALVAKALSNSGMYSKQEYDKLPPEVRECVGGSFVLHDIAMSENPTDVSIFRTQFLKTFEARRQNRNEINAISPPTREQLGYQSEGLTKAATHALPEFVTAKARDVETVPHKDIKKLIGNLFDVEAG